MERVNRRSVLRQAVVVDNCATIKLLDGTLAIAGKAWDIGPEFWKDGVICRNFARWDGRTVITLPVMTEE
jgi:hypothetical protein